MTLVVHPRRTVDNHNHNKASGHIDIVPPPPPLPPSLLTEFSGGLARNMDLQTQYERPAFAGDDSHSAITTSVWRLSTQYSSPSSSSSSFSSFSSSPSSSTTSATPTATATPATCTQPQSYLPEGEEGEEDEDENESPSIDNDPDQDPDSDTDTDPEEADTFPVVETESTRPKYRYKHIFSTASPALSPASSAYLTTHHPYRELSFNIMTGPDRTPHTSSTHRANPLMPANQPPRPPNAWILYRSDKLKNIPSPPPGAPKRPQAEVSKMISQMWKLETPDVRAHYERLSEIKKAEHQAMYPGYRFQPMKKEDKDRMRAEKQAEKDREREARKASRKTRVAVASSSAPAGGALNAELPPLFTTEARVLPTTSSSNICSTPVSAPSFPSSSTGVVASSSSSSSTGHHPGDLPTPPDESGGSTPLPPASSSSSSAATATLPPLVAPQPTPIPQQPPSPSAWEEQPLAGPSSSSLQQHQQYQQPADNSFSFDSIPTWFDSSLFLPDPPSGADSYITVPLPSQQPLGWSPDDPGPLSDMHLAFFDPSSSSTTTTATTSHPTLSLRTTDLPSSQTQPQTDPALPPPPPPPPTTTTATVHPDQLQLHAVLAATNDPNIFSLDFDFANNDLFDGTREIQVSMPPGPSMLLSAFNDLGMGINPSAAASTGHANDDLTNFLNWDASNFSAPGPSNHFMNGHGSSSYHGGGMDYSLPLGLDLGIDMDMDGAMDSFNALSSHPAPLDMGASMSMMMSATPSLTSANTSQTSLNPTPPPLTLLSSHAQGRNDEDEGTEKGSRNVSRSNSDSNSTPNAIKSSDHLSSTTTNTTPYVPPAGAIHASTRRVAADWRRIRAMTPDPELDHPNTHSSSPTSNRDTTSVQA